MLKEEAGLRRRDVFRQGGFAAVRAQAQAHREGGAVDCGEMRQKDKEGISTR